MIIFKKLKEQKKKIDTTDKQIRKFGFLFSLIVLLIMFFLYIPQRDVYFWLWLTLLLLLMVSSLFPKLIYFPYIVWMIAAAIVGSVVSNIILITLFYSLITPIGFIARIFKRDLLNTKARSGVVDSYWIKYVSREDQKIGLEKLF